MRDFITIIVTAGIIIMMLLILAYAAIFIVPKSYHTIHKPTANQHCTPWQKVPNGEYCDD